MRYIKKIIGERIYLSPINPDDYEIYTKWINDFEVSGNLGNHRQIYSFPKERDIVEKMAVEGSNLAIIKNAGDILLGNIGFHEVDQINRSATVGLFIGEEEHRGKGYGTEALRLMLGFGFNTLNFHNIMLIVHADNGRGIACYKKVGFRECGRRHEARFKDGRYIDVISMEILEGDYRTDNKDS